MAKQIASNKWIYSTFSKGPNDSRMPTKSVIEGYGLKVEGSYASNQLVAREDIYEGLINIPFYVILKSHSIPYQDAMVYYQYQYRFPQYFNLFNNYWGNPSTVDMVDGVSYPIYMDTMYDAAGDTRYLNFDSYYNTREYAVSMDSPSFNLFAIPANLNIYGIYIQDIFINFYDAYYTPIGSSGSVTTNFCYKLSLAYKTSNGWNTFNGGHWTNQYGQTVTGSMVGYSERYILQTGSNLPNQGIYLNSNNLYGIAIVFDFYDRSGGGNNNNSSW